MDEQTPRIELVVRGDPDQEERVPVRSFVRATDSLTDLLAQVVADDSEGVKVGWYVRNLSTGSAKVEVEGIVQEFDQSADVVVTGDAAGWHAVRRVVEAIETLERGEDVRRLLSYPAIEKVRALTNLLGDGATGIVIRALGREVSVTETSAIQVHLLLDRKHRSFGSVEGRIETLSVHEKRPYFNVFHALDGYAVKCRGGEDIVEQATMSLGGRVRVLGEIVRRFDGRPESVEVSEIRVLRRREELPTSASLNGILLDGLGDDSHEQRL